MRHRTSGGVRGRGRLFTGPSYSIGALRSTLVSRLRADRHPRGIYEAEFEVGQGGGLR